MDAVDPQVDVVDLREIPLSEGFRLVLPLRGQPGDRGRRQAGTGAEELLEGGPEVAGRQAVQVQQRQHLGHLGGPAGPGRQDRRREPLTLACLGIDALVVDPWRLHRHRTGGGHHVAFGVVAVAYDEAVAVVVDFTGVPGDVIGDLGLQGCGEHLPGTVANDLIEQRPACTGGVAGLVRVSAFVYYREHGRAFPPARQRWS